MFRILPSLPQVSPYGSGVLSLRSVMGDEIMVEACLAADLSLLKHAIQPIFCVPVEQIHLFGSCFEPLPDSTWIRRLPVTDEKRILYVMVEPSSSQKNETCHVLYKHLPLVE